MKDEGTTMIRKFSCVLAGILALFAVQPSFGADLGGSLKDQSDLGSEVRQSSPWNFSFVAYQWLPWISGDMTVRGRPVSIDVSPGDVLDALDWSGLPAWMSSFEARKGKIGLFSDIVYAKLAGSASFARSVQGRFATATLGGRLDADYQQTVIEFGAAYEFWSSGAANSTGASAIDILAGGRYWNQKSSISADLNATIAIGGNILDLERSGNRVIARSGSVDWVDPFVGLRLRHQIAPGQKFTVRGDIGGFGVGSDLSWQAVGSYDFQILQRSAYAVDAYIGYRALSVDYTEGSGSTQYRYNALQHGPVLGLNMRF